MHWIEKDVGMLPDIPAWQRRQDMKHLTNLWMHRPPNEQPKYLARQPPVRPRPISRVHEIQMEYACMG